MPATVREDFLSPMAPANQLSAFVRRIRLPISKVTLFFYDSGGREKPVLFLWHGLGDEADTWQDTFLPLSDRYRVIAPDLPGFGRSEKPARRYTPDFLKQCMLELADQLDVDHALWAGHSLGAMLCQSIALDHPQRVSALVLISGGLVLPKQKTGPGTLLFLLPGVGEMLYNGLRKDPQKAYETLDEYYAGLQQMPEEFRNWLWLRVNQRVWDNAQRRAYFSTLRNLALKIASGAKPGLEKLRTQKQPVLILWGAEDQVMPAENAAFLAQALPNARLVIVPGAGHNVQQEKPAAILEAILNDERLIVE